MSFFYRNIPVKKLVSLLGNKHAVVRLRPDLTEWERLVIVERTLDDVVTILVAQQLAYAPAQTFDVFFVTLDYPVFQTGLQNFAKIYRNNTAQAIAEMCSDIYHDRSLLVSVKAERRAVALQQRKRNEVYDLFSYYPKHLEQ